MTPRRTPRYYALFVAYELAWATLNAFWARGDTGAGGWLLRAWILVFCYAAAVDALRWDSARKAVKHAKRTAASKPDDGA